METEIQNLTTLLRRIIVKKLKRELDVFIYSHLESEEDFLEAEEDFDSRSFAVGAAADVSPLPKNLKDKGKTILSEALDFLSSAFNYKDIRKMQQPTFSETLLKLIDERGLKDSEVYGKVGIDRRLFSKIRIHPEYKPAKSTVLMFAIALELTVDETKDFLETAGYSLSRSIMQDLIVEFFISRGIYDIMTINEALYDCGEKTLGV